MFNTTIKQAGINKSMSTDITQQQQQWTIC